MLLHKLRDNTVVCNLREKKNNVFAFINALHFFLERFDDVARFLVSSSSCHSHKGLFRKDWLTTKWGFTVCFEEEFPFLLSAVSVKTHTRTCAIAHLAFPLFKGRVIHAWICSPWARSLHRGSVVFGCSQVITWNWWMKMKRKKAFAHICNRNSGDSLETWL